MIFLFLTFPCVRGREWEEDQEVQIEVEEARDTDYFLQIIVAE